MEDPSRGYKYSCRKCPIRQRCIDDKGFGPGMMMTLARRFETGTDTFETWDMLQQDCLLVRQESQGVTPTGVRETGLGRRLRQARETPKAAAPRSGPALPQTGPKREVVTPLRVTPLPAKPPVPDPGVDAAGMPTTATASFGLTLATNDRILRLPDEGDIVFGRFEHGLSNPPDIDLTYEDGVVPSVSRRHALVICRGSKHWMEDMGSVNGTYVNGHQLPLGKTQELTPGDRILLGRCRLIYNPLAAWMLEPDPRQPHIASVLVTHNGHRIDLPDRRQMMIGRPDPALGYVPDVDLSIAGDIAMYVSRRHAQIITRSGTHFLEEMGSAAGTRLNGKPLHVGDVPEMLRPGDQIWLGGCVVAYEWTLL